MNLLKEATSQILGISGRMISYSKSGYRDRNPNNLVIFNANVCTKKEGKIWYGDLDITIDQKKLSQLAKEIGQDLHVLYEMDGRFENEESPKIEESVLTFSPDGSWKLGKRLSPYVEESTLTLTNQ